MTPSAVRLAPLPRRRALLLLAPLAVLASVLLGLLAQSASAHHTPVPSPGLVGPPAAGQSTTPQWTFTTPAALDPIVDGPTVVNGATTTVTITHEYTTQCVYGPSPVGEAAFSGSTPTCASPYTGATDSDGTYALSVRTVETTTTRTTVEGGTAPPDKVDRRYSAVESSTYLLDRVAPGVTVVGPATAVYDGWTVSRTDSGGSDVSYSCRLDGPGATVGSSFTCNPGRVQPALGGSGDYTLTVTATDAAANSTSVTSAPFTHDAVPPVVGVTLTTSPATGNERTPSWSWTADEGTVQCVLSGPAGFATLTSSCTGGTYTAPTLTISGTYMLTVRATDAAGNVGTDSASYTLDVTPPTISVSPAGDTTGTAAGLTWTVTVGGAQSVTCTVDGVVSSACTATGGTVTASRSTDGVITLTVTATDEHGNAATPVTVTYTRSTTPATPVVTVPTARDNVRTVTWTVVLGENTTGAGCALTRDGVAVPGIAVDCTALTGPGTYAVTTALTDDGLYRLAVTATNSTSGTQPVGAASYSLDTTAAAGPVLTPGQSGAGGNASPLSWSWTPAAGHTTECRLTIAGTAGGWDACTSPFTVTPSAQGTYLLEVRHLDDLRNAGSPSSASYVYDSVGPARPTVTLVGTSPRQPGDVTWTTSTTPDTATVQCRLLAPGVVTGVWQTCSASITRTVTGEGTHTLEVRLLDAAGNPGEVGSATVLIDGVRPPAPVVAGADSRGTTRDLSWSFTHPAGSDGVAFRCRLLLDGVATGAAFACTSNYSATVTSDGAYRLEVVAVDAAGNLSDPTLGPTRTVDTTGPVAPSVTLTTTSGKTKQATWTVVVAADAVRSECRLTRTVGTTTSEVRPWQACAGYTMDLLAGDGVYVLHVRTFDDLDNQGAAAAGPGYTLDATPPDAPIVTSSRSGTDNERVVTYTFSGEGTPSCALFRGGVLVQTFTGCASPLEVTLPATDGTYTLRVTYTDTFLNESAPGESGPYTLDVTPPATPTVTGSRSGTDNELGITYAFSGEGTATCRLYRGTTLVDTFTGCQSPAPFAVTLPAVDGVYTLQVEFTDQYGNLGAFGTSESYTLDVTPPGTPTVTGSRSGTDNERAITYAFTGEGTATCRLYRGTTLVDTFTGCQSPAPFAVTLPAVDGVYTLQVEFTDQYGNLGAFGTSGAYTLDVTPPGTPTVTGSRSGTDNELSLTYDFAGEGTATCRLYRGTTLVDTFADCHSPQPFAVTLPAVDGVYTLQVEFTDQYGNLGAFGTSGAYTLDVTPPATPTVTGSRSGTDNERAITYDFAGEGTAVCRLYRDGVLVDTFVDCHTPMPLAVTLPAVDGTYTLQVEFTDQYGNTGAFGTSDPYTLDVTPPGLATVTVTPSTGNVRSATWTVTAPEAGTTAECRLRHVVGTTSTTVRDWHACQSPHTYALTGDDGRYLLDVRLTDAVGNLGGVATGQGYLLDTTAPAVPTVLSDRVERDNERVVTYTFSGEGTATCRLYKDGVLVGVAVVGCTSPYALTLPDESGRYVLQVTYTDSVDNTSAPGSSPEYELDVTPPDVPVVTSDRTGTDNEPVVTFAFSGEGTATCQLTRNGAAVGAAVACTSPYVVTLPSVDGSYVLLVRYTDAVGNTSAAGASPAYLLDLTPPPAPVVSGPPSTGNTRSVSWSYTGEGTATCTLLRDGVAVGSAFDCGPTGYSTTLSADGSWTLAVTFTDAVGNRGPPGTSPAYLLDTVAPAAPRAAGPTGPSQSRTPSWTVGTDAGTTTECRLVRGGTVINDWMACAGGFSADLAALPDGGYVLESRATDAAGNVSAVGTSAAYVLDTTAPLAPSVTGPSGPSQSRTPSFTWTGESGARSECQLSRDGAVVGGWVACSSGYAPTLSPDGTWTLAVRLVDAAGNVGEPASSGGYVLDTTAPPPPVVTPPSTPGRDLAPSWGAVVEGGTTLECRFTGPDGVAGPWITCALPLVTPLTGRPDGTYLLEVRATDVAGNVSGVGSGSYVLDTVAPAAAVVIAPTGAGRTRTPTFTFTTEAGAATRCRLTSGSTLLSDFVTCTSPVTYDLTDRPDGTYTLTVRVTDAAGNPGPAATGTYVLDTTGPLAPVFTLTPGSPSPSRTATWAFTVEPGSSLICRLTFPTGAVREISGCSSPLTVDLTGLPDGSYTLTIRAVDGAGNVGAVATSVHVLDSTALAAPVVTPPATPDRVRTPTWTFTPTAGTAECRLVRGTTVVRDWGACTTPTSFTADLFNQPDGTYSLLVRVKDAAGAVSAATTSRYVLDTTPPAAATLVGPPTPSTNRAPTWSIASAEAGATAMCRVLVFDSVLRNWEPCAVSPAGSLHTVDLTGRGDGTYTLVVRLTDAAGNIGTTTASSAYVLDTAAPAAVGVTGPDTPGRIRNPTWLLSTSGGTQLECRLSSAAGVIADWLPCAGEFTADLTDLPDGTYTLAVRAVSAAGTSGPPTAVPYVLSTVGPGAPTAVALRGVRSPDNDRAPTWTFTLLPGTTGFCRVVQGPREVDARVCSGTGFTLDLSSAADGTYTLTVFAVDAAGNRTAAPASTYVLDTEPTDRPVFTQVPGATGSTLDPQWRFTVVRGASAQCRLLYDGRPLDDWASCDPDVPYTATLTGRPDGRYTLQVRAVDSAVNTSEPQSDSYLLDRTAVPLVRFTATPTTPDRVEDVSWTVTAPDGVTLECRVVAPDDTTTWGPCGTVVSGALRTTSGAALLSGTVRLDLAGRPDGEYVLEVRVVQADGRTGAVSRASYVLDTRPPTAPAITISTPVGKNPTVTWFWTAPADDLVECRLVKTGAGAVTGWSECAEGQHIESDLTRFGQGSYLLEMRLTDAAGNSSLTTGPAYRYDTTSPGDPAFTGRPSSPGTDRTVTWTFTVPGGTTATCTVKRDAGVIRPESACTAGQYDLNLSGLPDGGYTLTVRLTDLAGNTSGPTSSTYVLASSRSGGPVRVGLPPLPPPFDPPPGSGTTAPPPAPAPGRTGTGAPAPAEPGNVPGPATIPTDDDILRLSDGRFEGAPSSPDAPGRQDAAPGEPDPGSSGQGNPLLPDGFVDAPVPSVIRDVAIGTITKPTLPLALLAIVVLFLLAQNRIDRRDPKLAAAPVEAEPELDFTTVIRTTGVRGPGGAQQ